MPRLCKCVLRRFASTAIFAAVTIGSLGIGGAWSYYERQVHAGEQAKQTLAAVAAAMVMAELPPKTPRDKSFTAVMIEDPAGPQEKFPIQMLSDGDNVVLLQKGPSSADKIIMNRAFAVRVLQALKDDLRAELE